MNIKFLFLFGALLIGNLTFAQQDFRPGYIIKNSGDTIHGEIDYRGDLLMSKVCRFKNSQNEIEKFTPYDIFAFRFTNGKYYISKEVDTCRRFLEYLIKGEVNIYYSRDEEGNHYFLDKADKQLQEIPYDEGIKTINGEQVYYKSRRHQGLLNYYMQDASGFESKIKSVSTPNHKSLIKLAEDYHNTVCEGEKCIIYDKAVLKSKLFLEFSIGFSAYSEEVDLNEGKYAQYGVVGHIWLPSINEKLYFRTGVLFSTLELDDESVNYYKIPCQLEYIYNKGLIRPRIAYGLNFYQPNFRSVSLNIGGNVQISEKLFLSATSDIEFTPRMLLLPRKNFASSYQFGVFFEF